MKDTFSTYHPIVNFSYFAIVFVFTMVVMHPAFLAISLVCGLAYLTDLNGKKAIQSNLKFMLPIIAITALVNPAFNHRGVTILTYLPNGNPLTLESITYGIAAGTMLAAIITWFSCYNEVMTSDKFIYLFGKIIPSLSLILSMALRFIPRFQAQIKNVSNAQKSIGRDVSNGGIIERARHGITILSITVSWALENAIETADSMKSRGYGLPGRSSFSIYRFDGRDKKALLMIYTLGFYVLLGGVLGNLEWSYFPAITGSGLGIYNVSLWLAYLCLCLAPLFINKEEEKQWEITQLKI